MSTLHQVIAAAIFAGLSVVARASEPDPAAIVRESREAIAQLKAVSYSAKTFGTGALAGKVPAYMATVSAGKSEAGGWRLYIKGKPDAPDAVDFEIGFDGVDARSVRVKDKVVVEKGVENLSDLAVFMSTQSARHPIAWEFFADSPLPGDESHAKAEGQVDVGGATCDVIMLPGATEDAPGGLRLSIGVSDHLPRRIERLQRTEADAADASKAPAATGGRVLELEDLKVNELAVPGIYAIEVPNGFRVKAAASNKPKKAAEPPAGDGLLAVGSQAPDWTLSDPDGKKYTLSQLKGKPVLMDFWATWCGPCRAAMPGVQRLHEKYKDKVNIFGVNAWESGDAPKFMASKGYSYTLLLKGDDAAKDYKVTGIPSFYLIGADGKILYAAAGFSPDSEKKIEELIDAQVAK